MPSNGAIANVILCDLDLNFQVQTLQVAILTSKGRKQKTYVNSLSDRTSPTQISTKVRKQIYKAPVKSVKYTCAFHGARSFLNVFQNRLKMWAKIHLIGCGY